MKVGQYYLTRNVMIYTGHMLSLRVAIFLSWAVSESLASHHRDLHSLTGQAMWDLLQER